MPSDDIQILRTYLKKRDEKSFQLLMNRYAGLVQDAARRQTPNENGIDEIVQNVFITLAKKAPQLKNYNYLGGWLLKTTSYEVRNWLRSETRRTHNLQRYTNQEIIMQSADNNRDKHWNEISPHIDDALLSLNEEDRAVMVMRFIESKKYIEIGKVFGKKPDTVRIQVSRNLGKLRQFLTRRDITLSVATLSMILTEKAAASLVVSTALTTQVSTALAAQNATSISLALNKVNIIIMKKATLYTISACVCLTGATFTAYQVFKEPAKEKGTADKKHISRENVRSSRISTQKKKNTEPGLSEKNKQGKTTVGNIDIDQDPTLTLLKSLKDVMQNDDIVTRLSQLDKLLNGLDRDGFKLLFHALRDDIHTPHGFVLRRILQEKKHSADFDLIVKKWVEIDPSQAFKYYTETTPEKNILLMNVDLMAKIWAENDPGASLEWTKSFLQKPSTTDYYETGNSHAAYDPVIQILNKQLASKSIGYKQWFNVVGLYPSAPRRQKYLASGLTDFGRQNFLQAFDEHSHKWHKWGRKSGQPYIPTAEELQDRQEMAEELKAQRELLEGRGWSEEKIADEMKRLRRAQLTEEQQKTKDRIMYGVLNDTFNAFRESVNNDKLLPEIYESAGGAFKSNEHYEYWLENIPDPDLKKAAHIGYFKYDLMEGSYVSPKSMQKLKDKAATFPPEYGLQELIEEKENELRKAYSGYGK